MDKTTIFETLSENINSKIENIRQHIAEQIFSTRKQEAFYVVNGLLDYEIAVDHLRQELLLNKKKHMKDGKNLLVMSSKESKTND